MIWTTHGGIEGRQEASEPTGDARAADQLLYRHLEHAVARVFDVAGAELRLPTRGRAPIAFARQVAMYLAHVSCRMSFVEIGRIFGRDRTTAAYACRRIEDQREDPAVDRVLEVLEALAKRLLTASAGAALNP